MVLITVQQFMTPKRRMETHTAELLLTYQQSPNNLIKVIHGEDNVVVMKCFELQRQKIMIKYQAYDQLLKLNSTYKLNKLGMLLYLVMIEDNYGVGQPVYYFWVGKNNESHYRGN